MTQVFLQPLRQVRMVADAQLRLGDVARCVAEDSDLETRLCRLVVGRAPAPGGLAVLPLTDLLRRVLVAEPGTDLRVMGTLDVVVEGRPRPSPWRPLLGAAAWMLLAVGAATAILNFHADVNMAVTHREIYRLLTGRRADRPLLIELPYTIGVAAGILVFFFQFRRPRDGAGEPSPLEVEMAQYEARVADFWRRGGAGRR